MQEAKSPRLMSDLPTFQSLLKKEDLMSKRIIEVEERLPLLPTIPLSLQHLFAMFGSTVLVPFLLHVDPATCLFMNGIGTLLYLTICKWKLPAYLGSSFAFISPVLAVTATAGMTYGMPRAASSPSVSAS